MGCINQVDVGASVPSSALALSASSELLIVRPNQYGSAQFANAMTAAVPELIAKGNELKPADAEALAAKIMNADFYFKNGDEIGSGVSVSVATE